MTPKGTANVFADSDGFLGIMAALCVKPFLCARLVSDVQMQLSCCLRPISKGTALFFSWELCSREGNITMLCRILLIRCRYGITFALAHFELASYFKRFNQSECFREVSRKPSTLRYRLPLKYFLPSEETIKLGINL
ncbi:hypothetical protein AVEN_82622-1 [Araneus ventricosus]|uniref:Uncharacterized protein n=1 Tax=Araneus ventricosus TaxID=182803 RepID=A0A4Y2MNW7_ARAVE|nr:hypothetical protein AVEN_82622-1 [Araneus ventricosus]